MCSWNKVISSSLQGVSQVKTGDTPFKKNSAFSKPIEESMDQTQPYDIENYPKMWKMNKR